MSLRQLLSRSVGVEPGPSGGDRRPVHFLQVLSRAEQELWFLALAAMLIDVTLTVHGLQLGLVEMNPVARWAMGIAGVLGLYGLKLFAVLVGVCCRPLLPDRYNFIVPLALALPSLFAVGVNTTLIAAVSL